MNTEDWTSVAVALGVTLVLFVVFVVIYRFVRGFMPGSRVLEQPLPGPSDLDSQTAKFKLFYTNWGPHCTSAKPIWDSFETLIKNQGYTYGGKTVVIEKINCETEKGKCSRYQVDSYPTFKLETNQKLYEYQGPADQSVWRTFLSSALGPEKKQ